MSVTMFVCSFAGNEMVRVGASHVWGYGSSLDRLSEACLSVSFGSAYVETTECFPSAMLAVEIRQW